MTFPVIANTVGTSPPGATSLTVNLPSGIVAGDLVIIGASSGSAANFIWPAGWTEINELSGASADHSVAYRRCDGSEGATITVTKTGTGAPTFTARRITGAHGSSAPELVFAAASSIATPDPSSLSPSWGAEDTLWIASTSRIDTAAPLSYPTNYSLDQQHQVPATASFSLSSAARQLNAASEDPGAFSYSIAAGSIPATIAIRPASFATFRGNGSATAGLNVSFTFDCGAADASKIAVIGLHQTGGSGTKLITAITVDGVNCLANVTQGQRHGAVWCALPTSSGVVTVALTYDAAPTAFAWGAWTITGSTGAPTDTQSFFSGTNGAQSLNLTVAAGGVALVTGTNTTGSAVTTTNATEDYDAAFGGLEEVGAHTTGTGSISIGMNAVSSMIGLAFAPRSAGRSFGLIV
jgi:hypothetical protein